jgi:hypothetical protein
MRLTLIGLGLAMMLVGAIFALQGFNVLPGSFMTGRPEWAVIGSVGFVVGLVLAALGWRRRP